MELESRKESALLFWFNTYGKSIKLDDAASLEELWKVHVPSLFNCLRTDRNTKVVSDTAPSTYHDLYSYLINVSNQEAIISSLSVEGAAEGDPLEIAKFLAVLLNEFRISKPDVITESVAVMEQEGQDEPLMEILSAFDEDQNYWWSVMLKRSVPEASHEGNNGIFMTPRRPGQPAEEFCGMSVNRSSFVTPVPSRNGRSRNNPGAYTVGRCDGSPLMEAINSPKVRELRRDREIKSLRRQLHEAEDQLVTSNSQVAGYERKVDSLVGEITSKNERIRNLEATEKLLIRELDELKSMLKTSMSQQEQLQRHCDNQKERIAKYKSNSEEWEQRKTELKEELKAKTNSLATAERQLRDAKDELRGIQQEATSLEIENSNLKRQLEEAKQAAELDRDQYHAAVSDWRKRCESEASEMMSLYSAEAAKNAELQRELREMAEHLEKVQKHHEDTKALMKSTIEELKNIHQQKYDAVLKRADDAESELARQEEKHKCFVSEHEATVRQLESAHLAEKDQRDSKLRSTRSRIDELESSLTEHNRVILEQRKELTRLTEEKDAVDLEVFGLKNSLSERESQLQDAHSIIKKLGKDVESVTSKYNNTTQEVEALRDECSRLQADADQKEQELAGMQQRLEDLMSLTDLHEHVAMELEQTRRDLESERVTNCNLQSRTACMFEELSEKLQAVECKNRQQAEEITRLESMVENEVKIAKENEERSKAESDQLREKDAVRTEQLLLLDGKVKGLESDILQYHKESSKLHLRILELEDENQQYSKCIEWSNFRANEGSVKNPNLTLRSSKGTIGRSGLPHFASSGDNTFTFLMNEDEPSVRQNYATNKTMTEVEDSPDPSVTPKAPAAPPPATSKMSGSCQSLPTVSIFGSTSTLPRSRNSKGSFAENMPPKRKVVDFTSTTDRSRVSELQKRNAMLHPAMRCAYATEVAAYNSPTGNENTVKHGRFSERRRSGVKLFHRATSYVKKRFPMSDSSNSQS